MSLNPILVQIHRGGLVESVHRGAYVVVEDGRLVEARGDVDRLIYPRSSLKPFQALPVLTTGAADRFGLTEEEIAVVAASHNGTDRHVELVRSILQKGDLRPEHLQCGAHAPLGAEARHELIRRGERFSVLHNNCSGKHAGMLLVARHLGADLEAYLEPSHPVQVTILDTLAKLSGTPRERIHTGCDGCNAPTHALPLRDLAIGYQRLTGPGAPPEARRLVAAIQSSPEILAGEGRFCTALLKSAPDRFLPKSGAEGVYAIGVPARGLALAIKIDDGQERGYLPVVVRLLERHGLLSASERERLGPFGRTEIHNWKGARVGEQVVTELEAEAEVETT